MTLEEYLQALRRHDWFYQYSDDHSVWKKYNENAKVIREGVKLHDPDYKLYNWHCATRGCDGQGN